MENHELVVRGAIEDSIWIVAERNDAYRWPLLEPSAAAWEMRHKADYHLDASRYGGCGSGVSLRKIVPNFG
jgi:hypothetical protein